jgi:regulator of sirC expression with transglutaminase-like and TPR domain
MIDPSTLRAMVQLLDDPDLDVSVAVENRLIEEGESVIDELEALWLNNDFPDASRYIELVINKIQKNLLHQRFKNWIEQDQPDLIEGWVIVTQLQYPGVKLMDVKSQLNDIKLDAWLLMGNVENDLDRIQILNHVFFEQQGFHGDTSQYHYPDNSFINRVLERKSGNPISLSAIYLSVAQHLGLPVFGINLPQHFVVGFCKIGEAYGGVKNVKAVPLEEVGKVVFYINPYSKGQIFTEENIDSFLKVVNVTPLPQFYMPCSVKDIIKRMLRNLHYSFGETQEKSKRSEVAELMRICGMTDEISSESGDKDDNS